jgi:hypothetical protein
MIDYNGLEKVIVMFDAKASTVLTQMRYSDFEACVAREQTLDGFAASTARAGYAIVGAGLAVRGIVLFRFDIDEEGLVDSHFNVPLDYLMQNAGAGPDLGNGPIHYASRSQCPVPWQANNLWESDATGDDHPTALLQRAVWRNLIGLKPAADIEAATSEFEDAACAQRVEQMELELTKALGEEGRVSVAQLVKQHKEQFAVAKRKFRSEMERQQTAYLERTKELRDEINRLKTIVRQEQDTNRRLQELMRRS